MHSLGQGFETKIKLSLNKTTFALLTTLVWYTLSFSYAILKNIQYKKKLTSVVQTKFVICIELAVNFVNMYKFSCLNLKF